MSELAAVGARGGIEVAVAGASTGEVAVADGTRVDEAVLVAPTVKVAGGMAVEGVAGEVGAVAASSAEVVGLSEEGAAVVVGDTVAVAMIVGASDP